MSALSARWPQILLLILAFLLYSVTLDNGLTPQELRGGDLITHQYAQVQARLSNAPGYPLYTIGGFLWFHALHRLAQLAGNETPNPLPLLSSYSMLWALAALWLLHAILERLSRQRLLNWWIAAFYATTYFFWYYATTTEQYSSAVAQTLAIVYVYLLWQERQPQAQPQTTKLSLNRPAKTGLLLLLAFLCGLSLAHMLTVAFIVPPLLAVILWQAPRLLRNASVIMAAILAALTPLLSYSYVYLRGAAHPEWQGAGHWATTAEWFWGFVSTAQGREELGWGVAAGCKFFDNHFPTLIWQELSIPLLALGLVGIALLPRRLAPLLYGTLAIYLLFCWFYRCGNWFQVIMPTYPLILLGLAGVADYFCGEGADRQQVAVRSQALARRLANRPWRLIVAAAALILAVIWRGAASLPEVNSHQRAADTALDRAAIQLDQPLPANAALFAAVDNAAALQYLTEIWRLRPDLQIVSSSQAGELLTNGRRLLCTWEALALLRSEIAVAADQIGVNAFSPDWAELTLAKNATPVGDVQLPSKTTIEIDGDVKLIGYRLTASPSGHPVTVGQTGLDVLLFWQLATGKWPSGLSISVRPVKAGAFIPNPADGASILQQDSAAPLNGLLAAEHIKPGSIVADAYRLPLPNPWPDGADGVTVILYRQSDGDFEEVQTLELSK
jgi:hypothetical protein